MTLEGDGERSNEQTKKRWKSVDEEERERRAYRVASERASETWWEDERANRSAKRAMVRPKISRDE